MNYIEKKDDEYVLTELAIAKICQFELDMKKAKKAQDDLRAFLKKEMEEKGIKKFENNILTITYVDENDVIKFDSNALKEKEPDKYNEYLKLSHVNSSIRISVKKV